MACRFRKISRLARRASQAFRPQVASPRTKAAGSDVASLRFSAASAALFWLARLLRFRAFSFSHQASSFALVSAVTLRLQAWPGGPSLGPPLLSPSSGQLGGCGGSCNDFFLFHEPGRSWPPTELSVLCFVRARPGRRWPCRPLSPEPLLPFLALRPCPQAGPLSRRRRRVCRSARSASLRGDRGFDAYAHPLPPGTRPGARGRGGRARNAQGVGPAGL